MKEVEEKVKLHPSRLRGRGVDTCLSALFFLIFFDTDNLLHDNPKMQFMVLFLIWQYQPALGHPLSG